MKVKILGTLVSLLLSQQASAAIFISEYIEGSGHNKAIEIANSGPEALSLQGYSLKKSTNGGGSWGQSLSLDTITLDANSVYVLSHPNANTAIQEVSDQHDSRVINFNGDDPIALFYHDQIVDMVGVMGDINFGQNKTLVRRDFSPSAVYQPSQWNSLGSNNSEDLGLLAAGDGQQPPLDLPLVSIMEIQGESWSSPLIESGYTSSQAYQTEGVITAIQGQALGNDISVGFFMQDPSGDDNPLSSDGIFVDYPMAAQLNVGDKVTVAGKVNEDYGWTSLLASAVQVIDSGYSIEALPLRPLGTDADFRETLERHEGMLIELDQSSDLRVTRTFGFDYSAYRNNMVLAHKRVNLHPNQQHTPVNYDQIIDSPAEQQLADNRAARLFVESFEKAANGELPWYPQFGLSDINQDGSSEDYIRIGDQVNGLHGVLGYSYGEFRLYVTNQVQAANFIRQDNERQATPDLKAGDLTVATFNVLNFFNSPFGGSANPKGQNRGATKLEDFELQGQKIVAALLAMNADIVGLMEIENNGFGSGSAIVELVSLLNQHLPASDQYQIAWDGELEFVGSDAITNQVIYKPSKLSLAQLRIIAMPEQHAPAVGEENGHNYQRDALTPTFKLKGSNTLLTVSVNHFKSKGSTCWEDVALQDSQDPNRQGSCEHFRVSAAYHLGESLAALPGHKLIIGDLNAYASEDPITVLTNRSQLPADYEIRAARDTFVGEQALHGENGALITQSYGYINTVSTFAPDAYGYSFNDEVGTLDYILASSSLNPYLVDASEWNINALESSLFEYSSKYTGDFPKYADAFRSSDHDPVLLSLRFTPEHLLGDFDLDGDVDAEDIRLFNQALRSTSFNDMAYDFNQDQRLGRRDLRGLIQHCTRPRCATF